MALLAMVALTSCMNKNARKNNYPKPSTDFTLPVGKVYTIDTLLYMKNHEGTHKFTQDASVYGIVTADETTGNLYKASFIQDGDKAIELYMKSTSGLRIGDSVRVYLKGATLSEYSGTPQIQDLDPNNVTILANNKFIAPDTITGSMVGTDYICRVVTFENVEFRAADRDNTYAPDDAYGQYYLTQYYDDGTSKDSIVVVRTSNYASFAKQKLPQGNGMITGILTYYSVGDVYQFTIRALSEVKMNGEPHEMSVYGTGAEDDPYNIAGGIAHQFEEAQWIKGFIVGAANLPMGSQITSDSDISWGPTFDNEYNILSLILADKPTERDINRCVVVYLPANAASGIRGINLKDHPENLHKTLKVKGDLMTFLGKSGMRNTNEYTLY